MRDAETKDLAQAWQAPATDSFRSRGGDRKDEPGLDRQARQWVSPSAQLFETADLARMEKRRGKLKAKGINGNGFGLVLGNQAQVWAEGWPGPAMRDYKGSNSAAHLEVSTGSLHLDQLPNFVEHLFLPLSCPAPPIPLGPSCSPAGPNGSPPSVRRKLNPLFVEALMRWPIGLSGFARRETEWTRWWQLMPSLLSDLGSREPVQMDLFE
jgi:DNA (cytosine-5)-methyltransferase 1